MIPASHALFFVAAAAAVTLGAAKTTAPLRCAWEDAPAEKKAAWEREQAALNILDLTSESGTGVPASIA